MFLQRQIAAFLQENLGANPADVPATLYRMTDILPKNTLKLGDGLVTSGTFQLANSQSASIPLPAAYTSGRASLIVRVDNTAKLILNGTSTMLLKGTKNTTDGEHLGLYMTQDTIASAVISNVAGAGQLLNVEYFMFALPDVTLPASWRKGSQTIGFVSGDGEVV